MGLIKHNDVDKYNEYFYQRDLRNERAKAAAPFVFFCMLLIGWGIAYLLKEAHIYDMSGYFFFGTPIVITVFRLIHKLSVRNNDII